MRFGEHFCAARFYKQGICRGICVKMVWDFGFGAVGILVTGAQRAFFNRSRCKKRSRRSSSRLELEYVGGALIFLFPLVHHSAP